MDSLPSLPGAVKTLPVENDPRDAATPLRALRVLIVEDSEVDAGLLVRALQRHGYSPAWHTVDTAADLEAALVRQPWDVVLSDYAVPGFGGLEALRIVRASAQDLPFILVSGTIGEDLAVEAMRAGAHDYLLKEHLARLGVAVARELGEAEERRGRRRAEDELRRLLAAAEQSRRTLLSVVEDQKRAEGERQALDAQLRQAQKMESVARLAGGIAHDFNNALGVILGHAEQAMQGLEPSERLHHHLEVMRDAALRSAKLTRQLLAFARKQTIAPRVLDLNDAVAGMLNMLRRLIGEDIHLAWMPGAALWPVKMDPAQIDQILANLLVNARDAIGGVGNVTVETRNVTLDEAFCSGRVGCVPGEYVVLAVSDDGCGMGQEVLDHLFEPFFTTKPVGQGTGLGLATVYGIVTQNAGSIDLSSEPGKGTTFRISLPRVAGKIPDARADRVAEEPRGHGETVLLVEDEQAMLEIMADTLAQLGYSVLSAGGPRQALGVAQEHAGEIQLLITDVVMPEMNGRELVERLTASRPAIRCLFVSGYTADVIAHRGVLDEGIHFLEKPFSRRDLAVKIRQALED